MMCPYDDMACPYIDTSGMDKTMCCSKCPFNKNKK